MARTPSAPPSVGGGTSSKGPQYYFPVSRSGWNGKIANDWWASRGGGTRRHKGNDIFAPAGTPVVATVDGTIGVVGAKGISGLRVWLIGSDGKKYFYAHLNSANVKPGQKIKAGQPIGTVGNTGNAKTTPAHLHFEVHERRDARGRPSASGKWTPINPQGWYSSTNVISGSFKSNMGSLKEQYTNNAIKMVNDYKGALGALGYKGSTDDEYIAWAILNNKTPEQFMKEDVGTALGVGQTGTDPKQIQDAITNSYRSLLGVAPSKETLAMHMSRFNGGNYSITDVEEFIRNSRQFKDMTQRKTLPMILNNYKTLLGIEDISRLAPATFNYVLGKFQSGEWRDENELKTFIMQSPQYRKHQGEVIKGEAKKYFAEKYGLAPNANYLNEIAAKIQSGSTYDQIENQIRNTVEFKKRYVGIKPNEDPSQYDNKIAQLNSIWLEYEGRPFDVNNPDDAAQLKRVSS